MQLAVVAVEYILPPKMGGLMLQNCSECGKEVSSATAACPNCGHPLAATEKPTPTFAPSARPAPVFSIIAVCAVLFGFVTPMILAWFPMTAGAACGLIGAVRGERPRWLPIGSAVTAILMFFVVASGTGHHGVGGRKLSAAKIESWNWNIDPSFGTKGTVKWNVAVTNTSERAISMARVEFSTYDANGKLLASTFTFVHAIPAGETRTADSFAHYYGNEKDAKIALSDVDYSE